jgi:raffinose/stachyose/melibiose transport system permease protein
MMKKENVFYNIILTGAIGFLITINIFMVYQIIVNAFKSVDDYNGAGPYLSVGGNVFLPPRQWTISSFVYFLRETIAIRAFINNVVVTVLSVIILIVLGSITALILAQYRVRFSGQIVGFLIGGQAIPIVMTILTTFLITRALNWIDTYQGVITAICAESIPFTIFLFYSYYIDLPRELLDSAEIDGASFFQVFSKVVLPMSGNIVATVGILIFIDTWATYLIGLIIIRKEQNYLLAMVIQNMEIATRLRVPVYFAAFVVFSLPMVLVARWAQRYISTGMLEGSLKE